MPAAPTMGVKEVHPRSRRKTVRHIYQGYFFMQVTASIFKAYDIRGIVPEQLDASAAYAFGVAFAKFTGCKNAKTWLTK